MNIEYWLYHNYRQYRFNMNDVGKLVDVDMGSGTQSGQEYKTFRFGGEVGNQWVSHRLSQGQGSVSFFSGMSNWRMIGEPQKVLYDNNASLLERHGVLSFVLGDKAFVILNKEGLPETRLVSEGVLMPAKFSQAIHDGVLVDFSQARVFKSEWRDYQEFPGTPPSPYN